MLDDFVVYCIIGHGSGYARPYRAVKQPMDIRRRPMTHPSEHPPPAVRVLVNFLQSDT